MAQHCPINGVKISATDDPSKVVTVNAFEGKSGDHIEISYTNCKVSGNGSFGIVFQAKLVGGPEDGGEIAIKKVLQDKRFKVRVILPLLVTQSSSQIHFSSYSLESRASDHASRLPSKRRGSEGLLL